MGRTRFVFVFLFVVACRQGGDSTRVGENRIRDGLIGSVKSVEWKIQDFDIVEEKTVWRSPRLRKRATYDLEGNTVQKVFFADWGKLSTITTFSRNWRGALEITQNGLSGENPTYFYRQYDKRGIILREWSENGKWTDRRIYRTWQYQWDEKKRMNEAAVYGEDGKLEGKVEWYYDDRYRLIRKRDVPTSRIDILYEYDDQNRLSKEERVESAQRSVTLFEYGREKEMEVLDRFNNLRRRLDFRYEFDCQGNWILQIKTERPIPGQEWSAQDLQKTIRTIEYY